MKKNPKLPKTYKTLLMLALVAGPFYWLAFTPDGQQRTDLALMRLLGKPELNAALDVFDSDLTESRLRELFPMLSLQCVNGENPFGDRLCGAAIGSFNGIPASAVTFFLRGERLRAVKLLYRRSYHEAVQDWVRQRLAARKATALAAPVAETQPGVAASPVADGLLVLREGELGEQDEPALMWLSRAAIDARH